MTRRRTVATLSSAISELDKALQSLDAGLDAIASMQRDIESVLGACIYAEHESGLLPLVSDPTEIKDGSSIHNGPPVVASRLRAYPDSLPNSRVYRSSKRVDESSPSARIEIIDDYPPVFDPAEFWDESSGPNHGALLVSRACNSPDNLSHANVQQLLKPGKEISLGTYRRFIDDYPPIFNPAEIQAESSVYEPTALPFPRALYSQVILPQENALSKQKPISRLHIPAGFIGGFQPVFDPADIQAESSPRNLAALLTHTSPDCPPEVGGQRFCKQDDALGNTQHGAPGGSPYTAENQSESCNPNLKAPFPPRSDIHWDANVQQVWNGAKGVSQVVHTRFDSEQLPVINAEEIHPESLVRLGNLGALHTPRSCVSPDIPPHADVHPLLPRDDGAPSRQRTSSMDDGLAVFNAAEIMAESTPNHARYCNPTPYIRPRKDALRLMKPASLGKDVNVSVLPPSYDVFGVKLT
jgi:hypothetical protein